MRPDLRSERHRPCLGRWRAVCRDLLHRLNPLRNLGPIPFLGWGNVQGKKRPRRINRYMHLGACAPLGPVLAGASPRL